MRYRLSLMVLTIASLALPACQSASGGGTRVAQDIGNPDAAVVDIRQAYAATPPGNRFAAYTMDDGTKLRSRAVLRRQSEDLLWQHPDHVDGRMTAALLAYEADDPVEAARHLDYLLRIDPAAPDAALLRARIALEEGNPQLARRLLDRQVKLRPDHAGLREAHASALYLTGAFDHAAEELEEAERLGAAPGRVAYNRGLIAEEVGDVVLAARHYQAALAHVPEWNLPAERLNGLGLRVAAASPSIEPPAAARPAATKPVAEPEQPKEPEQPTPAPQTPPEREAEKPVEHPTTADNFPPPAPSVPLDR